jgi:hypothetical protein
LVQLAEEPHQELATLYIPLSIQTSSAKKETLMQSCLVGANAVITNNKQIFYTTQAKFSFFLQETFEDRVHTVH